MSASRRSLICAGTVIDGTAGGLHRDWAALIEDDRFAAVGPRDELLASSGSDVVVIEAPGHTLIPGLVDAHVHLGWGLDSQPTWPALSDSPEGHAIWAASGAQAALAAGVTSQRDCGSADLAVLRLRDAIGAGVAVGPRLVVSGPCVTTTAGHGDFIGVTADSVDEVRRRVRELCALGVDVIKVMASGGDMDPHTNRHQPQFSDAELHALVADAHRLGLPVVAHCNPTSAIRQAVAAGVDTIAHCNWLGGRAGEIEYDEDVASLMLEQGTVVDLNVEATVRAYVEGDGHAMGEDFLPRNRWELHADLRDRGAKLIFTSDEFGERTSLFPLLLTRAIEQLGLSAVEVIHRATQLPAAALRLADTGTIAPGKQADCALLDGDLERDPRALLRVTEVRRAGTVVVAAGRVGLPKDGR